MLRSLTESVFIHLLIILAVTAVVYSGVQAAQNKPQTKTVVLLTSMVDPGHADDKAKAPDRIKIPSKPAPSAVKHSKIQPKKAVKEIKKPEPSVQQAERPLSHPKPDPVIGVPVPAQVRAVQTHDSPPAIAGGAQTETGASAETAVTASVRSGGGDHVSSDKTSALSGSGSVASHTDSGKLATEYSAKNYSYILALIKSNLKYPYVARVNRWTGRVVVRFDVADNGGVSMVSIVSSSGHSVLDDMVKNAVNDSAPFPHPPVPATIIIPVSFSFNG